MSSQLFIGNDNLIEWIGAINEATGEYLNQATCRFSIYDEANQPVVENVSMSHVPNSNGNYIGTLQSTVTLAPNQLYYVDIILTQDNLVGRFRCAAVAVYRD